MSTAQKIDVACPQCKAKLAVPVSAMGKSGKCPHCQHVFPLAMPAQRPAAPVGAATAANPLTPLTPAYQGPASFASGPDPFDGGLMPLGSAHLMPLGSPGLSDAGLMPLPASSNLAPLGGGNPFAGPGMQGDYTLQSMAPAPYMPTTTLPSNASIAAEHLAMANASIEESKRRRYDNNDGEGWGINAGIGGGAIMMLVALIWFCSGLIFFDYLFFAPPIIFVVGLIAFFKGIADNFMG